MSSSSGLFDSLLSKGKAAASQAGQAIQQQADRHGVKLPASMAPAGSNAAGATHEQQPAAYNSTAPRAQVSSLNDLRQLVTKYNPSQSQHTLQLQMLVKSAKGVVEAEDAVASATKTHAKQLFAWSQSDKSKQATGLVDTGDRLAYLLWAAAEVHSEYAAALENSRGALKDIRNFENKLAPNRDRRAETRLRLKKLVETKADTVKIESVQNELAHLEANDEAYEASILALKQQKLQEGFGNQFKALAAMGEQLSIIAGYGQVLLSGLEQGSSYGPENFQHSAAVREGVESALAKYDRTHPRIPLPSLTESPDGLSRNSTVSSFGQTHREHLDDHTSAQGPPTVASLSPPSGINMTPVAIPVSPPTGTSTLPRPIHDTPHASEAPVTLPQPTVAETGIPVAGGANGPSSGQLKPRQSSMSSEGQPALEAARQNLVAATSPPANKEELRRQEIEDNFARYSSGQGSTLDRNSTIGTPTAPPPYQSGV